MLNLDIAQVRGAVSYRSHSRFNTTTKSTPTPSRIVLYMWTIVLTIVQRPYFVLGSARSYCRCIIRYHTVMWATNYNEPGNYFSPSSMTWYCCCHPLPLLLAILLRYCLSFSPTRHHSRDLSPPLALLLLGIVPYTMRLRSMDAVDGYNLCMRYGGYRCSTRCRGCNVRKREDINVCSAKGVNIVNVVYIHYCS